MAFWTIIVIHLCCLLVYSFTGNVAFINEKNVHQVPRRVLTQGVERLGIESDGTIWADCDLHPWRHNQHSVTLFLLSKGFDLFDLIESGEAIDATANPTHP